MPEAAQPSSTLRNFAFSFLIILATVFFALGVMLPAIRFTTVFVWTNQHSIATIIWALYKNEEFFLCFVIFMFSIFFPFLKLFYLLTLVTSPDMPAEFRDKSISAMEWLGRYSMTDVMVLALMIFYINASGYTEAVGAAGRLLLRRLRPHDDARLRLGQLGHPRPRRPQARQPAGAARADNARRSRRYASASTAVARKRRGPSKKGRPIGRPSHTKSAC